MPTFARQRSQTFPHSRIEAFDQGRIELLASARHGEQALCFLKRSQVSLRVTSTTRFFFVCLITVAIQSWGHTSNLALPGPACFFTFSRKTRRMLFGYAFHPSVQARSARMH